MTERRSDQPGIPPDWKYHKDVAFSLSDRPPFMWHRPKELSDLLSELGIDGAGLRIGIVDTGYTPHPWLPKPAGVRNFTSSGRGREDVTARNHHGEHVFGIIGGMHGIGLLPKAEFYIAKCLGDGGSGQTNWLNAGRRWLADQGCHFLNGSYGGPVGSRDDVETSEYCAAKGMQLEHFAGGNSGYDGRRNTIIYPAGHGLGSCNGSYDADGGRSSFSSGGPQLQLLGAGGRIVSTVPGKSQAVPAMGQMSGSSMGSPDVLAKLGAYAQARSMAGLPTIIGYRAWDIEYKRLMREQLIRDAGTPGRDNYHGYGQLLTRAIISGIKDVVGA